jgi:hypothetical protein
MEIRVENVPAAALPILYRQLEGFGSRILLESEGRGVCESVSGTMRFDHEGDVLTVRVVKDAGHFPRFLILGGIRQTILEAVELANKGVRHAAA